jgi:hypothetical protein
MTRTSTRKRARVDVETPEYLKMLRRLITRAGARVADADEYELSQLLELENVLQDAIAAAVNGQRELYGRSWADIAKATGKTRQAAQKRWADTTKENDK